MVEVTFLGTSSMFPTKDRNHAAMLLRREGDYLLFDCGEGTQRQLRIAGISPYKIDRIFITHWHGDHSLGIGGIIQSLSASRRERDLKIFGPEVKKRVKSIMDTYVFHKSYNVVCEDVDSPDADIVDKTDNWEVSAINVRHGPRCLAYSFEESGIRKIDLDYVGKFGLKQHRILGRLQKGEDIMWKGKLIKAEDSTYVKPGKKIVYITDTEFDRALIEFSEGADLLVCEATYGDDKKHMAMERTHFTASDAANLAKESGAKKLVLTHFSQRYPSVKPLVKEAKEIFDNTVAAEDFMTLKV
jgi:ribonuclease Z